MPESDNPAEPQSTSDESESTDSMETERGGRGRLKALFWLGVAAGIAAAATVAYQRRKLAAMSDDEIRAMLEEKLSGRMPTEQLAEIQDTVIAKVRGAGAAPRTAAVTGTVTYREDVPMPDDAVVIVKLEDTSRMDAPAEQIGVQVIENAGSVPVAFSVGFDPAAIIDSHAYSVRATITSGDELLWTTDTNHPVITRGNPLTADLLLIAVPRPVAE